MHHARASEDRHHAAVDFDGLVIRVDGDVNEHCYWDYGSISDDDKHKLVDTGGRTYFPKYVVQECGVTDYLWRLAQAVNAAGGWFDQGRHGQQPDYNQDILQGRIK